MAGITGDAHIGFCQGMPIVTPVPAATSEGEFRWAAFANLERMACHPSPPSRRFPPKPNDFLHTPSSSLSEVIGRSRTCWPVARKTALATVAADLTRRLHRCLDH